MSSEVELFQVKRVSYVDQHGFPRREPFKTRARTVTVQDDVTAKDESGVTYRRVSPSKWYDDSNETWREAWSGHLGEEKEATDGA